MLAEYAEVGEYPERRDPAMMKGESQKPGNGKRLNTENADAGKGTVV
jgi:hypothetical protein